MSRYRNNSLSKTLKDYAVPLVGLILIVILLFSVFSGENNTKKNTLNDVNTNLNTSGVNISLGNNETEAYIVYENGKKVLIEDSISLQKSERIEVESGNVIIKFPLLANFKLKEKGELLYKNDGSIVLESGNLWIEALSNIDLFMKYAEVSVSSGNIINLSQNALESVIYSIDGNILVSNLAGKSVQLKSQEKITILSKDSTSNEINLDANKEEIDEYFKLSAWFKENNGDNIIKKESNFSTGSTLSGEILDEEKNDISGKLIEFDKLSDESYVKTDKINISGRYSPLKVGKITINNIETKLDSVLGTFSVKGFVLNSKINDLVVKIFDKELNLISKKVITVYNSKVSKNIKNLGIISTNNKIENFPVKATDFYIYEPTKTGKLTTTSSQVTIRGRVSNKDVAKVLVNDYSLKSYNGSTWRYHAFVEQGTLKKGANNYEIKYLDKNGKLIYKEYYSIYKEFNKSKVKVSKKISNEAKIN